MTTLSLSGKHLICTSVYSGPSLFNDNVCFIKIGSKLSSVLLLCLLRIFMKQTLLSINIFGWRLLDLLKIIIINNYLQTALWQVQSMQN